MGMGRKRQAPDASSQPSPVGGRGAGARKRWSAAGAQGHDDSGWLRGRGCSKTPAGGGLAVPTTGNPMMKISLNSQAIKQGNEKAVLCWYQSSSDSSKEFV